MTRFSSPLITHYKHLPQNTTNKAKQTAVPVNSRRKTSQADNLYFSGIRENTTQNLLRAMLPYEKLYKNYSDEKILEESNKLQQKIQQQLSPVQGRSANEISKTLKNFAPQAFALFQEVFSREKGYGKNKIELRDTQLLAAHYLIDNVITEVKTGEGKTYSVALNSYLKALVGEPVFIFEPNDYLTNRDAQDNQQIFERLGLTVSTRTSSQNLSIYEKRKLYKNNIIYSDTNTLIFDYLQETLSNNTSDLFLPDNFFSAIVEEADDVMLDKALSPYLMSAPVNNALFPINHDVEKALVKRANNLVCYQLEKEIDFEIFDGESAIALTESGIDKLEEDFKLPAFESPKNGSKMPLHYVNNALKAHYLMKKGKDYTVDKTKASVPGKSGIVIIDRFTTRKKESSRFQDGLHQALEARNNLPITSGLSQSISISVQDFLSLFKMISGVTGTTDEISAKEFKEIYNMDVKKVQSYTPSKLTLESELIFPNKISKFIYVLHDTLRKNKLGRPVLIGTGSINDAYALKELMARPDNIYSIMQDTALTILNTLEQYFPGDLKQHKEIFEQLYQNPKTSQLNELKELRHKLTSGEKIKILTEETWKQNSAEPKSLVNQFKNKRNIKQFIQEWAKLTEGLIICEEVISAINKGVFNHAELLTAEQDKKEAWVVSKAGKKNAITISTNIAGRGTDIKLGGDHEIETFHQMYLSKKSLNHPLNDEEKQTIVDSIIEQCKDNQDKVKNLGGLHVIQTELQSSKRIEDQLKGRAGRMGDPGTYALYRSLDDSIFNAYFKNQTGKESFIALKTSQLPLTPCNESKYNWFTDMQKFSTEVQKQVSHQEHYSRIEERHYTKIVAELFNNWRQKKFELRNLQANSPEFITWLDTQFQNQALDILNGFLTQNKPSESLIQSDTVRLCQLVNKYFSYAPYDQNAFTQDDFAHASIEKISEKIVNHMWEAYYAQYDQKDFEKLKKHFLENLYNFFWLDFQDSIKNIRGNARLYQLTHASPLPEFSKQLTTEYESQFKSLKTLIFRSLLQQNQT